VLELYQQHVPTTMDAKTFWLRYFRSKTQWNNRHLKLSDPCSQLALTGPAGHGWSRLATAGHGWPRLATAGHG
jgi:hypothetical protein